MTAIVVLLAAFILLLLINVPVAFSMALAVVVFLQVFNRFVLKAPLAWSEDLAMLLFQWVVFLGAAVGVRRLRHFGIDLVVKKLPARMRRTLQCRSAAAAKLFCPAVHRLPMDANLPRDLSFAKSFFEKSRSLHTATF